ncbi:hypothetical protein [Niastella sp. OAS944]|uniref:hypothetical protein n=1 Tax=Niastella sp. OAS944 TaxID=2664089 RepID=UPI003487B4CA|nr:hypothetical protein [Chitinophagaceae bacterium OAS944]
MKAINIFSIAASTFALVFIFSCNKNSDIKSPLLNPPVIITRPVTVINSTSVVSGGEFTNTTTITDKGIIWGTDSSALTVSTINKISNGAALANFMDTIQVLQPNTTYYVKAFAVYSTGVSYGAAIKFTTPPTVYTAGYHGTSAAYWKDGKLFPLAGGTYAHSIYVVGNDVYVAGENNNGNLQAVYWKNGVPVMLSNGTNAALANSIYVVGTDVYVGGYELYNNNAISPVAKYWKNGVAVSLTDAPDYNGIISSVYVVGNDVYAAGWKARVPGGYQVATYWKNGIAVHLNDSTTTIASAQSIFVKGNDVYVCGKEQSQNGVFGGIPVAKYWKNGIAVSLTDGLQFAGANSIFVNGGDVYTSGYEYSGVTGYSVAKYWKNGVPTSLTDGTKYGNAYSIYSVGSDVYVAGGEGDYFNAMCWKNGVSLPIDINAQYSRSVSIFVQ